MIAIKIIIITISSLAIAHYKSNRTCWYFNTNNWTYICLDIRSSYEHD